MLEEKSSVLHEPVQPLTHKHLYLFKAKSFRITCGLICKGPLRKRKNKTPRPLKFDFTCRESVYTQRHRRFIIWKCVYMCDGDSWPWGIWPLALRVIQACTWTVWYAQGHISGFCPHLWLPVSPGLPHESQQQAAATSFPCENSLGLPKRPWLFSTKIPSPPTCCPRGIVTLNYKAPLIRCR